MLSKQGGYAQLMGHAGRTTGPSLAGESYASWRRPVPSFMPGRSAHPVPWGPCPKVGDLPPQRPYETSSLRMTSCTKLHHDICDLRAEYGAWMKGGRPPEGGGQGFGGGVPHCWATPGAPPAHLLQGSRMHHGDAPCRVSRPGDQHIPCCGVCRVLTPPSFPLNAFVSEPRARIPMNITMNNLMEGVCMCGKPRVRVLR
jgi:hypothetical protein